MQTMMKASRGPIDYIAGIMFRATYTSNTADARCSLPLSLAPVLSRDIIPPIIIVRRARPDYSCSASGRACADFPTRASCIRIDSTGIHSRSGGGGGREGGCKLCVRFGVPVHPQFTCNTAKVDATRREARASAIRDGNNRAKVHADNGTCVGARARPSDNRNAITGVINETTGFEREKDRGRKGERKRQEKEATLAASRMQMHRADTFINRGKSFDKPLSRKRGCSVATTNTLLFISPLMLPRSASQTQISSVYHDRTFETFETRIYMYTALPRRVDCSSTRTDTSPRNADGEIRGLVIKSG